MRRAVLAAALAAVLVAVPAADAKKPRHPPDTFRGTCEAQVRVRMSPPMSSVLRDTRVDIATRRATCTGTVERRGRVHRVNRARTTGRLRGFGPSSCQLSSTAGRGYFTIARRWRIDFTYLEPRLGPLGALPYTGVAGGSALDLARLSDRENLADIVQRCDGAGVPSVLVDVTIATTPSISG